jgi:ABC-2 type transport system permease protein
MRYARLYAHFLRFSFSRAMEFRLDFFFRVGMDAIFYAVNLLFFWVIYQHTPFLGGWNFDQALVFIAGVFLLDAFHMTVFANNMWWFPLSVNKGDLDYYLVRPVSTLFFLSLRDFAANSFLNLLLAVGILIWALSIYPEEISVPALVAYAFLLSIGMFLQYILQMLFQIPVFWMQSGTGLRDLWFSMSRFSSRPDAIFTGWARRILTTILPLALLVSFPTRVLFGGDFLSLFGQMAAVAIGGFLLLLLLWRWGLSAYGSASS